MFEVLKWVRLDGDTWGADPELSGGRWLQDDDEGFFFRMHAKIRLFNTGFVLF